MKSLPIAIVLSGALVHGAAAQKLVNPGFEQRQGTLPEGWRAPPDSAYALFADSSRVVEGRFAARMQRVRPASTNNLGSVSQRFDAVALRGRLVRFRAFVRTDVPSDSGSAHLWLRVDLPNGRPGALENMADRPIRNSTWQSYEVRARVDDDAAAILVGFMLQGRGTVWVDSASFGIVDENELGPASPLVEKFVAEALGHMKRLSVRRDSIDWPKLEQRMQAWARGARTTADYYPALRQALRQLGDNHSFHMPPQQTRQMQTRGGSTENPAPVVQLLPGNIGYVEIRGYSGFDREKGNAFARELHAALQKIDSAGVCRWVVDLRRNTGGNMWPMMAGIGPVLGNGLAGKFVSADAATVWGYDNDEAWTGAPGNGSFTAKPQAYRLRQPDPVVAVLTSGQTASSGEAVAVAFRGRPGTRTFGKPSYGVSTANTTVPLSDSSMILLTVSRFADRLGNIYGYPLPPDEVIDAERKDDLSQDATVAAATRWLNAQPCRPR